MTKSHYYDLKGMAYLILATNMEHKWTGAMLAVIGFIFFIQAILEERKERGKLSI